MEPENDFPDIAAPARKERKETPELDTYKKIENEEARRKLLAGEILENIHVSCLDLSSGEFSNIVLIKNCVVGEVKWGAYLAKLHMENVRFLGDFSIAKQENSAMLVWKECRFDKNFCMQETNYSQTMVFNDCRFLGELSIRACKFEEILNLADNLYQGGLKIRDSRFLKGLRLAHSEIDCEFIFNNNNVEESFNSDKCDFQDCNIHDCRIQGKWDVSNSSYAGQVNFHQVFCSSDAKFGGSQFSDKVNVRHCRFDAAVTWSASHFTKTVDFSGSCFNNGALFVGCTFDNKVNLEKTMVCDAHFHGSYFRDAVSMQRMQTKNEFLWQDVRCEGEVNFNFVDFTGRVSFSNMKLLAPVTFYRATFKDHAWFLGTRFQDATFVNTTFEGQAFFSFDRNTLNERNRRRKQGPQEKALQFVSVFEGVANFTNAVFYRKTVFENVFFKEPANFQNACFAEEINFQKTHFQKETSFRGSFCSQEMDFTQAVFDDYVNFDSANINRRLNLTDATMDKGISFYHAVIDVVVVEREQIEGRLLYEGMVPERREKKHLMRVKEEYLILKESLNQRGKFDDEDWAYYRYRLNDRRSITEKAWRSLLGRPILAVQDDVPPEDPDEQESLEKQVEKRLQKSRKKVHSYQSRIEKKDESREKQLLLGKLQEEEERVKLIQEELEDTVQVLRMNEDRYKKWLASKEKPFSKFQALGHLLKNSVWKIVDWGTGYGVKPFRIAFLAAAVIFLFALVYFSYDVPYPNHTVDTPKVEKMWNWIYFSAMTFATSSPEGEALAYNDSIKFFIMTEALMGVFLMALFVGCYTRKIIR